MNVVLWAYEKKKNSTARPLITAGTQFTNVQLKEETSVINPVLLFNPNSTGMPNPFTPSYFNYCLITSFSKYYFISDWQYLNGIWACYLTEDVLATYKTGIGATTAYVERSASNYNGYIVDGLYPVKKDVSLTKVNVATSWYNVAPSGGTYVIGVISTGGIGAIRYYALNQTQLNSLIQFLFSNNIFNASNITEVGEGLYKSLFNPFQYIVSCIWFPFSSASFGSTTTNMYVGYWDTGVQGIAMTATAQKTYVTATIPSHPQISRGNYLNYAPYTRINLYLAPFGSFAIDPTYLRIGSYMYSAVLVDHITGQATIRIAFSPSSSNLDEYNVCMEKSGMMGIPIQLAQVMSDYSSGINTVAGALTTGSIVGAVVGAIGATIQTGLASQFPQVSTSGANGSFIETITAPVMMVEHYKLVDEDLADFGRPLMSSVQINTLSGYVKCVEAHYSGACMDYEKDVINNYMVSGFYYE